MFYEIISLTLGVFIMPTFGRNLEYLFFIYLFPYLFLAALFFSLFPLFNLL